MVPRVAHLYQTDLMKKSPQHAATVMVSIILLHLVKISLKSDEGVPQQGSAPFLRRHAMSVWYWLDRAFGNR